VLCLGFDVRWRALPAVLAALLVPTVAVAANPRASGLWGARSSALAGSVTAGTEDCSSSFYNPGNLARGTRSSYCLDYSVVFPGLDPSGLSEAGDGSHSLGGGLVSRGELFGFPFGIGAMLALPGAKLSRFEAISSIDESWVLETNRPRVSFSALAFGVEPLPRWSLGAALHVLAGVRGAFGVSGQLAQPNVHDSQLRHAVDADLASSRSFAVGAGYDVSESLRLALTYRHRAKLTQRIEGQLAGTIGMPPGIPADYRSGSLVTPAAFPSLLTLALLYRMQPSLSFGAELSWEDFSEWPSPDARSQTALTISGVPIKLLTMPPPPAAPAPHDRVVPRFGVEYRALSDSPNTLAVRAGYAFERSPLPPQSTTRWLDADRHTLTAGVGFERELGANTALAADVFGAFTLLPERRAVRRTAMGEPANASGSVVSAGAGISLGF
jgi:hypothetical protein